VADWSAWWELLPVARESTLFDCHTEPPLPGLSTRTGSFTFDAPDGHPHGERPAFCSANDAANAPCELQEDCPSAWIPIPDRQPQFALLPV
jgi:hypothetical protein